MVKNVPHTLMQALRLGPVRTDAHHRRPKGCEGHEASTDSHNGQQQVRDTLLSCTPSQQVLVALSLFLSLSPSFLLSPCCCLTLASTSACKPEQTKHAHCSSPYTQDRPCTHTHFHSQVRILDQGIHLIGTSEGDTGGIAIGDFAAGAPPGVWKCVGAVLNVGVREHEGMQGGEQQQQQQHLDQQKQQGNESMCEHESMQGAQHHILYPLQHHQQQQHREEQERQTNHEHQQHSHQQQPSQPTQPDHDSSNYMWLPVLPSKVARHGLSSVLVPALHFLSHHLSQGRRVLVHDDQGA